MVFAGAAVIRMSFIFRKPKVTRKVTDGEKTKTVEIESSLDAFDANSFDYIESMLGTAKAPSPEVEIQELQQAEATAANGNDIMEVLPTQEDNSMAENFVIPEGKPLWVYVDVV